VNQTAALGGVALLVTLCGCECGEGTLTRLGETERTIAVGQSFIATYETGGSYCNAGSFAPAADVTHWVTRDTATIALDSLTGQITGRRIGDAHVTPTSPATLGPPTLLVHVR